MISGARLDSCECSPVLGGQVSHSLRIKPHVCGGLRIFKVLEDL